MWNRGSPPLAMAIPPMMGMSVRYVMKLSRVPMQMKAKMAVKKGVVAPTAWLKETGRYFKLALPGTVVAHRGGGGIWLGVHGGR